MKTSTPSKTTYAVNSTTAKGFASAVKATVNSGASMGKHFDNALVCIVRQLPDSLSKSTYREALTGSVLRFLNASCKAYFPEGATAGFNRTFRDTPQGAKPCYDNAQVGFYCNDDAKPNIGGTPKAKMYAVARVLLESIESGSTFSEARDSWLESPVFAVKGTPVAPAKYNAPATVPEADMPKFMQAMFGKAVEALFEAACINADGSYKTRKGVEAAVGIMTEASLLNRLQKAC